jgi:hypothetical protein
LFYLHTIEFLFSIRWRSSFFTLPKHHTL